ncbi:hypothetical protein Btru_026030 [Bulinus truncatus]|nr:hypothetical protein Btru_026030 [Bulinus truncatus]
MDLNRGVFVFVTLKDAFGNVCEERNLRKGCWYFLPSFHSEILNSADVGVLENFHSGLTDIMDTGILDKTNTGILNHYDKEISDYFEEKKKKDSCSNVAHSSDAVENKPQTCDSSVPPCTDFCDVDLECYKYRRCVGDCCEIINDSVKFSLHPSREPFISLAIASSGVEDSDLKNRSPFSWFEDDSLANEYCLQPNIHGSQAKSHASQAKIRGPKPNIHGSQAKSHASQAKSRGPKLNILGSQAKSGSQPNIHGSQAKSHASKAKSHGPKPNIQSSHAKGQLMTESAIETVIKSKKSVLSSNENGNTISEADKENSQKPEIYVFGSKGKQLGSKDNSNVDIVSGSDDSFVDIETISDDNNSTKKKRKIQDEHIDVETSPTLSGSTVVPTLTPSCSTAKFAPTPSGSTATFTPTPSGSTTTSTTRPLDSSANHKPSSSLGRSAIDRRKQEHLNQLEKGRRITLRNNFDHLRSLLPELDGESKAPRQIILDTAILHIQRLKENDAVKTEEYRLQAHRLVTRKKQLTKELKRLQSTKELF